LKPLIHLVFEIFTKIDEKLESTLTPSSGQTVPLRAARVIRRDNHVIAPIISYMTFLLLCDSFRAWHR